MNYLKIAVFFSALPSAHAREHALTQLCDACTRFENLEFSLQPFTWSGRNVERTICSDGWRKPSSISHVFHLFCCRLPGIRPPHQRTPLVWGKGKSGTKKKGNCYYVVILTCWNTNSAFRGMQMSSGAKRNITLHMKILNYFFLSIMCSTLWLFLCNRIWRQLLKKEKKPKTFFSYIYSIYKYIYICCCISSSFQITSSPKKRLKKDYFTKGTSLFNS